VAKGSVVREGDLLLRLANADYRAQVAVAESAVEAAGASLAEAERAAAQAALDLSRYEKLEAERIASREVVDQLRTKREMAVASRDAARARLLQARSSLDAARAALSKTELRAPFGGIVAELTTEVGEWITPSPPGIPLPTVIQLLDPAAIYVSAPMDEVDVARVAVGLPARIGIDAYPGKTFAARVTRVAPYVSDVKEQNRTFEIEAELDDDAFAKTLRPGTSADVEVILAAKDGVLRVPSDALLEGPRVLVVKDGRLVSVPVTTGLKNWAFAEVVAGLSEGDPVVVSLDRIEVKEGARARVEK
jgi:HlyD family secretion protein